MRAEVHQQTCFSFARCIEEAPRVFALDDEGRTVAAPVPQGDRESGDRGREGVSGRGDTRLDDEGEELEGF